MAMTNMNLLTLANNHLWNFGLDWLEVPENQVLQLVSDYGDDLAITAAKMKREFTIKWGDGEGDRLAISPTLARLNECTDINWG